VEEADLLPLGWPLHWLALTRIGGLHLLSLVLILRNMAAKRRFAVVMTIFISFGPGSLLFFPRFVGGILGRCLTLDPSRGNLSTSTYGRLGGVPRYRMVAAVRTMPEIPWITIR